MNTSPVNEPFPVFLRENDLGRLIPVGKTTIRDWIVSGKIRSHLIKKPGCTRGMRLIETQSVLDYVRSQQTT